MPLTLALSLACATVVCGPAEASETPDTPVVTKTAQAPEAPEAPAAPAKPMKAMPAKLVAFDGAHDFMKLSRRLRVWREAVDLDMKVDATGEATECEVVQAFRKTYINKKLCEVAMAHHKFEPARNAQNEAVEGMYRAHLVYADLREELE